MVFYTVSTENNDPIIESFPNIQHLFWQNVRFTPCWDDVIRVTIVLNINIKIEIRWLSLLYFLIWSVNMKIIISSYPDIVEIPLYQTRRRIYSRRMLRGGAWIRVNPVLRILIGRFVLWNAPQLPVQVEKIWSI